MSHLARIGSGQKLRMDVFRRAEIHLGQFGEHLSVTIRGLGSVVHERNRT